ncbi:MAG: hypothetical protein RI894_1566 [Bacteroidota bacterium]|jgi:gliding motility-associated lipoprotein GldH
MKLINTIFFLIAISIVATSCNKNKIFEQRNDIAQLNWANTDVQTFEVKIPEGVAKYRLKALVRYAKNCPIEGLLIHASIITPNGSNIEEDGQIPIKLNGNNQGEGLGDLWDTETIIADNLELQQAGLMKVSISHSMLRPKVPLIMKVGLLVEKVVN